MGSSGMMQPTTWGIAGTWPWNFADPLVWYVLIISIGLSASISLVHIDSLHPVYAAVVFFAFLHVGDRFLVHRKWEAPRSQVHSEGEGDSNDGLYLWWMEWDGYGMGGAEDESALTEDSFQADEVEDLSRVSTEDMGRINSNDKSGQQVAQLHGS